MLGQLMWTTTTTALTTGGLTDLWGDPNDVLRYVKASTLKVMAGAWAVVCRRSDVQRVLNEFWRAHSSRVNRYALVGRFPITGVLHIRVSAVDSLAEAPAGSVGLPLLAATSPVAGRPDLDTVVWLGVLTKPNERYSDDFFCETEQWLFANYSSYAVPRAEWSKGWA
ncbi:cholesterol oxidase substrate-binding domain-containing protein, partial [Nostocoides jenkinsii]|uniref:cholesterol oxidase substrate-binding domain-containing protein n=1 Tax=Nostocoides jenkinsii TaxID=330834 RepID=UPI00065B7293